MPRIHVIGTGGVGKTVLASRLASALQVPHIELDSMQAVREALAGRDWVTDGNYSKVRQIIWQRAQVVVWLDYPFVTLFSRLLRRSLRRALSRELLWGTNRESFLKLFFSRESLLVYVIRDFRKRRTLYEHLSQAPEYKEVQFVRLRTPRQSERWFEEFISSQASPGG
jgi:adenylate kinase family enzyme